MVVFLDIERAFKTVTTHAIQQELSDQDVVNCNHSQNKVNHSGSW